MSLVKVRPYLVGLPHLLGLRTGRHPSLGLDGAPGDPRLHPRLHRRGGGRPDPPARRAAGLAPGHAGPARLPAVRRQRGGRDLAGGHGRCAASRPCSCCLDRPCRRSTGRPSRPPPACARGGYVLADARRRHAGGDPDRHRLRGVTWRSRPARSSPPRASAPGWSACRAGSSSIANRPSTATRCFPPSVRARVAVEQASTLGWERYVGSDGAVIGMHTFGASAPLKQLLNEVRLHPRPGGGGRPRVPSDGPEGERGMR